VVAVTNPDEPRTVIVEYVPGGVPAVVRVSVTLVAPLPAGTVVGLKAQLLFAGRLVHKKFTTFGKVPIDGATCNVYVAVCPAITVCGPEPFAIEKPKPPTTVTARFCVWVVNPGAAA
jgi:hypothetical protein